MIKNAIPKETNVKNMNAKNQRTSDNITIMKSAREPVDVANTLHSTRHYLALNLLGSLARAVGNILQSCAA